MEDKDNMLLAGIRSGLIQGKEAERPIFDSLDYQVLNAYRAALGRYFTIQDVIDTAIFGSDLYVDWDMLDSKAKETLSAIGARRPWSIDKTAASEQLSGRVVNYLREQGIGITEEKSSIFPKLLESMMAGLEESGVKFDNGARKNYILGLRPLVNYQKWLVTGRQFFMNVGNHDFENSNYAIKAIQNALTTALVIAGDIDVDYGIGKGAINGITKAGIEDRTFGPYAPFLVTYETNSGDSGKIDVLNAHITSLTQRADNLKIIELIHKKKINSETGIEDLGYTGSIEALVGMPKNISDELRANLWIRLLNNIGVDFSKNAEAVSVHPDDTEKVTFFYTVTAFGVDHGVRVALTFDECSGGKNVSVWTRDRMRRYIADAENLTGGHKTSDYSPLLNQISARSYVASKQRLTQPRL